MYCVVPRELAGSLHAELRRHFRNEPSVEVVVERRGCERRTGEERRDGATVGVDRERRRINNLEGRRVGERRARLIEVELPELPRRARRHRARLAFVERLEPSTQEAEDLDTARLVTRFQAGERDVFADLYLRFFDRVYGYLLVIFRSRDEAEEATQQVFTVVLENLARYERRAQPFRAWLFTIVRNSAGKELKRRSKVDVLDPVDLDRCREPETANAAEPVNLDWLLDRELLLFVERLPLPQRQVLVLKYMLGLTNSEIARVLERNPDDVRALQSRALAYLRKRLTAVRRGPTRRVGGPPMRRRREYAHVLRARRFALLRH